ncbi:MAG TPA: decaprenyl-phosphate phosphoribosyltransferase [Polyangia bacterium]
MLGAILQTARPKQWVKNLFFVAAPLVFSKHLGDPHEALRAAFAVALFCALSSAVYLLNDVVDLEKDRVHPTKCKRPIAAGRLSVRAAKVAAAILGPGSIALGLTLGLDFALVAAGYLVLNIAYSLVLKQHVYVDVLSIATGFLLRVVGGALAIGVSTSPYLLVCTVLIACFLGFGKRAHELAAAGLRAGRQRKVLERYRPELLRAALWATGLATLVSYILYTRAAHTLAFFHTERMVFTAPFAAFGLARFGQLVTRSDSADSPTDAMLRDWPFLLNIALWAVAIVLIIYFRP